MLHFIGFRDMMLLYSLFQAGGGESLVISLFQHLHTCLAGADVSFCWRLLISEKLLLLSRVVALVLASGSDFCSLSFRGEILLF